MRIPEPWFDMEQSVYGRRTLPILSGSAADGGSQRKAALASPMLNALSEGSATCVDTVE
jgi:hypothetical protein